MRSTWLIFCMFVILSCASFACVAQAVDSTVDRETVASIKAYLALIIDSMKDERRVEDGDCAYKKTQVYKDFRRLCVKNWGLLLDNWNDLIDGKNEELSRIALFSPFMFESLSDDEVKEYMRPMDYIAFARKAVPLFKKMNDRKMASNVIGNGELLFVYNYRHPDVRTLLTDAISVARKMKIENGEEDIKRILSGDRFFYEVSKYEEEQLENENLWNNILYAYVIGDGFNVVDMYLLHVYSAGMNVSESHCRQGFKFVVKRSVDEQIMSLAQIRESVHDILINHPMSEVDEKAYQNMARRWLPCSYSAELELLKILDARKLPLDRRMMITDVLWKGVYATDQVQRFLPLLRDQERGIRESSFESMPAWLKEGMQYDASKQPSSAEFAALSAVAAENMKKHQDRLCQIQ